MCRLKIYYGYNQPPPPPPPPAAMKPVEPMKLNVPPPVQVVAAQQQMMNPQPPPAAAQRLEVRPDMQPMPMRSSLRPLSTLTVPEGEFAVKETNPDLGKAVDYNHHYDLVEHMSYLFIRVVRARGLAPKDANGSSDPVCVCLFCKHLPGFFFEIPCLPCNCPWLQLLPSFCMHLF